MANHKKRIIVGISGASGSVYGVRLLEVLRELQVETHLVMSKSGMLTLTQETSYSLEEVHGLADNLYPAGDIGACIASGSFRADGMLIVPCSVRTMSAIATGVTDNLLTRAADVTLKEKRRLILAVREFPLHLGHLRTMALLAEMGAVIAPPVPAFYPRPATLEQVIDHTVGRLLDLAGIENDLAHRWQGIHKKG